MTAASVQGRTRERIEVLDGLRLVAALMVVLYHYTYRAEPEVWGRPAAAVFSPVSAVTGYGFLGVELFFLISGFVICMSGWGRTVGRFATSRVVRLYPAYWFGVLATTAVLVVAGHGDRPGAGQVLVNVTMLQKTLGVPHVDGVYWSLATELQFYLLFAVLVWRGVTARRVMGFGVAWLCVSAIALATGYVTVLNARFAPYFVAGMVLYLVHRFGPTPARYALLAASYAVSLYGTRPIVAAVSAAHGAPLSWPVAVGVLTGAYAAMIAVALGRLTWIRGSWLTLAGCLTYPLYLLHQQIGYTAIRLLAGTLPPAALVCGLVAAMLAASWAVHVLAERPVARLLRRTLARLPLPPRHR